MIKALIAFGIGFSLGTISYIITRGLATQAVDNRVDGTVFSAMPATSRYGATMVSEKYGATPVNKRYGAEPVM